MQKEEFVSPLSNEVPCLVYTAGLRWGVHKNYDLELGYEFIQGIEKEYNANKFRQEIGSAMVALRARF